MFNTLNMFSYWFIIISTNLILRGILGGEVVMAFTPPISFSSSLISFATNQRVGQQQRDGTNNNIFSIPSFQQYSDINHSHLSAHVSDSSQQDTTLSNHVKVGRNTYYRTGSKDNNTIMNNNNKQPVPPPNTNDDQSNNNSDIISPDIIPSAVFDRVVNARYACTRFLRHKEPEIMPDYDNNSTSTSSSQQQQQQQQHQSKASISNPSIIQKAQTCLSLSQRSPTGFNAQPYRIILVHTQTMKENVSQYCLGRNADRVRDSDCTAVFLADRECGRDGDRFVKFLMKNMDNEKESSSTDETSSEISTPKTTTKTTSRTRRPLSPKALLKLRLLILLFSSGYPLPQFLSKPISFCIRLGVSILSFLTRTLYKLKLKYKLFNKILPNNIQLLPTLSSSTTWSQKNTMLVAMTYMLGCTSNGLATCPMEGYDAHGICKVLKIPRGRFTIPIIVSTGMPYHSRQSGSGIGGEEEETDDVGLSHGSEDMSPRYPLEEVVFGNTYGVQL